MKEIKKTMRPIVFLLTFLVIIVFLWRIHAEVKNVQELLSAQRKENLNRVIVTEIIVPSTTSTTTTTTPTTIASIPSPPPPPYARPNFCNKSSVWSKLRKAPCVPNRVADFSTMTSPMMDSFVQGKFLNYNIFTHPTKHDTHVSTFMSNGKVPPMERPIFNVAYDHLIELHGSGVVIDAGANVGRCEAPYFKLQTKVYNRSLYLPCS